MLILFAELQQFKYFQLATASTSVFTTSIWVNQLTKDTSGLYVFHASMGTAFAGTNEMESPVRFICEENRLLVRKWIIMGREKLTGRY
jgi:hypothetical protein